MARLRPGFTKIGGKDRETARALLDAADALGENRLVVQTTIDGFIVPDAVYEKAAPALGADQPAESAEQF